MITTLALYRNATSLALGSLERSSAPLTEASVAALWASLQLIAAALCGQAAVQVCDMAQRSSIELKRFSSAGTDWRALLREMPESVSRAIHLTESPHGTVFKAFMLLAALLMLNSEFPKHDLYSKHDGISSWGFSWTLFCAFRAICPTLGIVMEIFIPMSADYILMLERFKQKGYAITEKDRHVFVASRLQQRLHVVAGLLTFMTVPALEGVALAYSLNCFFRLPGGDDMVHWGDGTAASHVWFAIIVTRMLTILISDACMLSMAYEAWLEPTGRFVHNPFYMYMPERHAVLSLFTYVMLMGLSVWFVSRRVWQSMSPVVQALSVGLAVVAIIASLIWMAQVSLMLWNKQTYLDGDDQKNLVTKILEDNEMEMAHGSDSLNELEELRKHWEQVGLAAGEEAEVRHDEKSLTGQPA